MGELFTALENPVITNLQHSLKDTGEAYPSRLPDLYDGEPIISIVKLASNETPQTLSIYGDYVGDKYEAKVNLNEAIPAKGLSVLWARSKIADLEERRYDRAGATTIDTEILKTALEHHLVSRLTSLVAVDITPSRDTSSPFVTQKVPTMLPEGWDFAKLAMGGPQPRKLQAANTQGISAPRKTAPIPSTASPHVLMTWLGLGLMLIGLLMRRRRRYA